MVAKNVSSTMPKSLQAQGDARENQRIMLEKKRDALQNQLAANTDATAISAALTQALAKRAADPGYVTGEPFTDQ